VDDILAGRLNKTKDWGINDHTAMADKLVATGLFNEELPDAKIDAVCNYAASMPSEVMMKFWRSLSGFHVKNTVKIHDKLSDRIITILNPNKKK